MLGREIKRLRIEANLTTLELAKAIGVKNRDVEAWESGVRPVKRNIEKLERFFEFIPGHLLYLPTTPQMPFEFVTYHNGLPTDYFFAEDLLTARKIFNEKFTSGDMALRTWKDGEKLTLTEAEALLSAWRREIVYPWKEGPPPTRRMETTRIEESIWRKDWRVS